jgi:F-type H+-transporting ATPase subunit b
MGVMTINITLIAQMITFILLVWFTMKYVWPPITTAMHMREKKIAAGIEAIEHRQRILDHAELEVHSILQEAKTEANHIINQAHKLSIQIIEKEKANARLESTIMLEKSQDIFSYHVLQIKEILRNQLPELSVSVAKKIINIDLDPLTQAHLLADLAEKI